MKRPRGIPKEYVVRQLYDGAPFNVYRTNSKGDETALGVWGADEKAAWNALRAYLKRN